MFQFNSQTLGLTYPQSLLTSEQLYDGIKGIFTDYSIKHLIIATEKHKDAGTHYHLAIRLGRPFRSRNERQWDILGEHPNLLRPRNYAAWVAYCRKDGNYTEEGTPKENSKSSSPQLTEEEIVSRATNSGRVEFLIWAGMNKLTYAKDIWDGIHTDKGTTITEDTPINGVMDTTLKNLTFTMEWLGPKALILIGDSGIGKTTWAKTVIPKPCLFVTHIDELKSFRRDYHKSILFDDVSFKHYPIQAQIHLVDHFDPRSIHVRYGTAYIPAGVTKFFTCNEDPISIEHPAIARRTKILRITRPLMFNSGSTF